MSLPLVMAMDSLLGLTPATGAALGIGTPLTFGKIQALETPWVAFVVGFLAASIFAGIVLLFLRRGRRNALAAHDSAQGAVKKDLSEEGGERERMRAVIASLGEAVLTIDPQSRITLMNFVAERLSGYAQDESIGQPLENILKIVDEETREPVACPVDRVLREGRIVGIERSVVLIAKDETEKPISLTASPIRDNNLQIVGVVLVFRDVQEGRALHLQNQQYRMMVEQAGQGVASVDMAGNIMLANAAMAAMHGYRADELVGKPLGKLRAPNQISSLSAFFDLVKKNGHHTAEEMHLRKDGSELPVETKISLLKDSAGTPTGMVVLTVDITERRQSQMQLQQGKDLAEAANRSKSEFLANMSHEIRTPMNGIIGMTELALDTQLTREQQEYLRAVKSSADALLTLLNDILDISKIEAGKLELEPIEFNLRMSVAEILKNLAIKAHEKGLELIYRVNPDVPNILVGDAGRVRQILINLVGNATKFTDEGEIAVHVACEDQTGSEVRLHFSVKDTGLGVPKDKQNRIFGAFSQGDSSTTRKFGGSGLGLAISAQLVKLMGGVIWVESPAPVSAGVGGQGSVFHFTARFKVGRSRTFSPMPPLSAETDNLRVLVVDDNATNRRLLEDMLKKWNMQIRFADGGRAALELLKETHNAGGGFDLVLLDANMPGMDGFAVTEALRRESKTSQSVIMMLTSVGIRGDAARCNELGVAAYLVKPITPSDLHDAIVNVLHGRDGTEQPAELVTRHTIREHAASVEILLGEDNPVNQMLAVKLLEKRNYKVTVANNGQEVIAALDASPGRYAVILMDIQMPVMDGMAATAAIREREKQGAPHIPIIALTAHAMKGDRQRCLDAGMDDYVTKPIRTEEIYAAIERNISEDKPKPAQIPAASQPKVAPEPEAAQAPAVSDADVENIRAEVFSRVDNDLELLSEVSGLFFEEYPKLIEGVREHVKGANAPDLAVAAHTLKGMLANLGGKVAADAALVLELAGKSGDLSGAEDGLNALESEAARFAAALKKILEETPA